jgi:hypothetical protein
MVKLTCSSILVVFAFPLGLAKIGWKIYFINGAWDILCFIWIYFYWVETRGKTLEEIDELFDGEKHTNVPNLDDMRAGKAGLDEILVGTEPIDNKRVEAKDTEVKL